MEEPKCVLKKDDKFYAELTWEPWGDRGRLKVKESKAAKFDNFKNKLRGLRISARHPEWGELIHPDPRESPHMLAIWCQAWVQLQNRRGVAGVSMDMSNIVFEIVEDGPPGAEY